MVVKKVGLFLTQGASLDVEVHPVGAASRCVASQLFGDLTAAHRHRQRRRPLFFPRIVSFVKNQHASKHNVIK